MDQICQNQFKLFHKKYDYQLCITEDKTQLNYLKRELFINDIKSPVKFTLKLK